MDKLLLQKHCLPEKTAYRIKSTNQDPVSQIENRRPNSVDEKASIPQPSIAMRKVKGNPQRAFLFGKNLANVSCREQDDMVVVDRLSDGAERKKIVTEEIGDMVVVDTLDRTPEKERRRISDKLGKSPIKTKLSTDNLRKDPSDLNANNRSRESTGTDSYTTSENEYYTAYDVTVDDDIGSLLYHTAFVDDVLEEGVEGDKHTGENPAGRQRTLEQINKQGKGQDVAHTLEKSGDHCDDSSFENISYSSMYAHHSTFEYPTPGTAVQVEKPFSYYKDYMSPPATRIVTKQPQFLIRNHDSSSAKVLDLSDGDVVSSPSTNDDEVLIDFPPSYFADTNRGSLLLMSQAALSSTPSSSPSSTRRSLAEGVPGYIDLQYHEEMAGVTPVPAPRHLRRRTSSTSSRSSMKRHVATVRQAKRSSTQLVAGDPRSPLDFINSREKPQNDDTFSDDKRLRDNIKKLISDMGDIYSTPQRPISATSAHSEGEASVTQETIAVIRVQTQQVHVRHTSLGSHQDNSTSSKGSRVQEAEKTSELSSKEVVISPQALASYQQAHIDRDLESGTGMIVPIRPYKNIVTSASRFRLPIAFVSLLLLFLVAAIVVMAVVFPLS